MGRPQLKKIKIVTDDLEGFRKACDYREEQFARGCKSYSNRYYNQKRKGVLWKVKEKAKKK